MSLCYACEPRQVGGPKTPACDRCGAVFNVERDEYGLPTVAIAMSPDDAFIVCTAETLAAIRRNKRSRA